jgi:hypothetical protein
MLEKKLTQKVRVAFNNKKRLVVPLMGFPGLNMTNATIKLAQQNYVILQLKSLRIYTFVNWCRSTDDLFS